MQRMESNLPQDGVLHGMQIAPLGLLYPTPMHHVGYFFLMELISSLWKFSSLPFACAWYGAVFILIDGSEQISSITLLQNSPPLSLMISSGQPNQQIMWSSISLPTHLVSFDLSGILVFHH